MSRTTYNDLNSLGFMSIDRATADYEYSEATATEVTCSIKLSLISERWERQGVWDGEELFITCNRGPASEVRDVQCYGRPCIYAPNLDNGILGGLELVNDRVGRRRFINFGTQMELRARGADGNAITLVDYLSWPTADLTHNYTGSNPTVEAIINNYIPSFPNSLFASNAAWLDLYGVKAVYKINVPVFTTEDDVNAYIGTGDASGAINRFVPEDEYIDNSGKLYYYDYTLSTADKSTHEIKDTLDHAGIEFRLTSDEEYIGFVKTEGNHRILECSSQYVLIWHNTAQRWDVRPFEDVAIQVLDGLDKDASEYGTLLTNIPRVDKLEDAIDYEETFESFNGKDDEMNPTYISTEGAMTTAYELSAAEANKVGTILYGQTPSLIQSLKEGLWMYGENPINSVIDLCLYPFDLSPFVTKGTGPLKFGAFHYNGELPEVSQTSYTTIRSNFQSLVLVDQNIRGIYNDFRDYSTLTFSLFLPYYGIISLPADMINERLKVEVFVDIYTATMRYYVSLNHAIINIVECAVGKHYSLMGNNWLSKSSANIEAITGAIMSGVGLAGSLATANPAGVIGNMANIVSNMSIPFKKPSTMLSGSSSAGLSIVDPLSCFLIMEQYETIKPASLNSDYGKARYTINTLSSCKGFTQVSDCKLQSGATANECDEILTLLKEGVII